MGRYARPRNPEYQHGKANAGTRSVPQTDSSDGIHLDMNLNLVNVLAGVGIIVGSVIIFKMFG